MSEMFYFLKSALRVRWSLGMLADRVLLLHSAITLLAMLWALLISQAWLSGAVLVQWVLAFVIWLEFKHGGE